MHRSIPILRLIHVALSVLGVTSLAAAQGHSGAALQRLEALAAAGSVSVRDDALAPLAFTGPELAVGARYGYQKGRHGFDAELLFGFGAVWNRFGHIGTELTHRVGAGYGYALVAEPDHRLALGGALRLDTDVAYLATWDDAHAYWFATAALWPTLDSAWRMGSLGWLEGRGRFALVSLASRPPAYRKNKQDRLTRISYYLGRVGDHPEWALPWEALAIELEAIFRFRDSEQGPGCGWGLGALARFARAAEPAPFARLYVGLLVSHGFGW